MTPVPLRRVPGFGRSLGVVGAFTTRHGGVAGAPFDSLTLATADGVTPEALTENWTRVLAALSPTLSVEGLALVEQVHGDRVLRVDAGSGPLVTVGQADAVWTTTPHVAVAVRVADCVPVLLAAPGGVAAVHAGWRGVAAQIVPRAVAALCEGVGCAPSAVHAAIGPHIQTSSYEVGPEVIDGLVAAGLPRERVGRPGRGDRWHADLGAGVRHQLEAAGVTQVGSTGDCSSEPAFFSYRWDTPRTGRMAGVVAWCP